MKTQMCPPIVMVTVQTCFGLLEEEEEGRVGGTGGEELSLTSVTEQPSGQEMTVPCAISGSRVRACRFYGCLEAVFASG